MADIGLRRVSLADWLLIVVAGKSLAKNYVLTRRVQLTEMYHTLIYQTKSQNNISQHFGSARNYKFP